MGAETGDVIKARVFVHIRGKGPFILHKEYNKTFEFIECLRQIDM